MPSSKRSAFSGSTFLVTSGPTSVSLDGIRVLTNCSSGAMGRIIVQELVLRGAKVTLLEGPCINNLPVNRKVRVRKFFFYNELAENLNEELGRGYTGVIHAAAVSDFEPSTVFRSKLSSDRSLVLRLRPTQKLVNGIKRLAPDSLLVAFKLEDSLRSLKSVQQLFQRSRADLVLWNSLSGGYKARVMRPDGSSSRECGSKRAVVKVMLNELAKSLRK